MLGYARVEAALAKVHDIPHEAMGALRGRIKHFQRLGIVPSSPGKGKKITYNVEDIYRWALCLELAQFGMDPTVIKRLVQFHWFNVSVVLSEKEGEEDSKFFFHPDLMAASFPKLDTVPPTSRGSVTAMVVKNLVEVDKYARGRAEEVKARFGLINLSRLRRQIQRALETQLTS
jgi:hypothetical protein